MLLGGNGWSVMCRCMLISLVALAVGCTDEPPVFERCGDGVLQSDEYCDDGNPDNTDACTTSCLGPSCGDGYKQSGEQCDDGNIIETDSCTNLCRRPRCGDGIFGFGEICDDGIGGYR